MTDLAEAFIAQGLSTLTAGLELEMEQTLADLRRRPRWTEEDARRDAEAFAEAEVTERDPLRAAMLETVEDRFGIAAAFAASVE
jgi:hypothetical protein